MPDDPTTGALRDYVAWHHRYDDSDSAMSWRLRQVQAWVDAALDAVDGPVRVLSSCAGDGRDVLEVLARRPDPERVSVLLVELHPVLVGRARRFAEGHALDGVQIRMVDAGRSDAYRAAAPADLVLLVGIFGNIDRTDLQRTIAAAPQLCRPGGRLIWSRGRAEDDLDATVCRWFGEAGFTELDHAERAEGSHPALGLVRYDGPPVELDPDRQWFTFRR